MVHHVAFQFSWESTMPACSCNASMYTQTGNWGQRPPTKAKKSAAAPSPNTPQKYEWIPSTTNPRSGKDWLYAERSLLTPLRVRCSNSDGSWRRVLMRNPSTSTGKTEASSRTWIVNLLAICKNRHCNVLNELSCPWIFKRFFPQQSPPLPKRTPYFLEARAPTHLRFSDFFQTCSNWRPRLSAFQRYSILYGRECGHRDTSI